MGRARPGDAPFTRYRLVDAGRRLPLPDGGAISGLNVFDAIGPRAIRATTANPMRFKPQSAERGHVSMPEDRSSPAILPPDEIAETLCAILGFALSLGKPFPLLCRHRLLSGAMNTESAARWNGGRGP